jgi:hypothetical protein
VFGLLACVCAVAPLFEPDSRAFIFSTVGIAGVASGIVGWRIARRTVARMLAIVSILLGVVGTVGMVTRAAALWTPSWAHAAVAPAAPPGAALPAVLTPAQAAGRIVALIEASHQSTGGYPSVIAADPAGWIVTPAGSYRMPVGDVFSYIPTSDLTGYRLQVSDARGVVARYDSTTRTITTG